MSTSLSKVKLAVLMLMIPSWNPVTFSPFHLIVLYVVFTGITSSLDKLVVPFILLKVKFNASVLNEIKSNDVNK